MQCSARLQTVPSPGITGDRAPTAKASRRLALQAVIVGGCLMLPLAAFSDRSAVAEAAERTARLCAELDVDAENAIARRLGRTETRRPDIARTAQTWLAEARRQCSGGDPERAELLYQRIIAAGDLPG